MKWLQLAVYVPMWVLIASTVMTSRKLFKLALAEKQADAAAVKRARAVCAAVDEAVATLEWATRHGDASTLRYATTKAAEMLKKGRQ